MSLLITIIIKKSMIFKNLILLFECQIRRLVLNTCKKSIILLYDTGTWINILQINIACGWHKKFTIFFNSQSRFFNFFINHLIEFNHWYLYIFLLFFIYLLDIWLINFINSAFIIFLSLNITISSANI